MIAFELRKRTDQGVELRYRTLFRKIDRPSEKPLPGERKLHLRLWRICLVSRRKVPVTVVAQDGRRPMCLYCAWYDAADPDVDWGYCLGKGPQVTAQGESVYPIVLPDKRCPQYVHHALRAFNRIEHNHIPPSCQTEIQRDALPPGESRT